MSRRRYESPDEYEMRYLREQAERAANRRNQLMTRGEIIDAIQQVERECGGNVGDHHDAITNMLRRLREAFE